MGVTGVGCEHLLVSDVIIMICDSGVMLIEGEVVAEDALPTTEFCHIVLKLGSFEVLARLGVMLEIYHPFAGTPRKTGLLCFS